MRKSRHEGDFERNPLQSMVQGVAPGCTRFHGVAPSFGRKVAFETFFTGTAKASAGRFSALLGSQTLLADAHSPTPAATRMARAGRELNTPGPIRTDDPFDVSEVL